MAFLFACNFAVAPDINRVTVGSFHSAYRNKSLAKVISCKFLIQRIAAKCLICCVSIICSILKMERPDHLHATLKYWQSSLPRINLTFYSPHIPYIFVLILFAHYWLQKMSLSSILWWDSLRLIGQVWPQGEQFQFSTGVVFPH